MGYTVNGYRYTNSDVQSAPKAPFPSHAQGMASAPTGSRPIKLYEPDGKAYWAVHHGQAWRQLEPTKDADGETRWRMNGSFVNNPVAWASS